MFKSFCLPLLVLLFSLAFILLYRSPKKYNLNSYEKDLEQYPWIYEDDFFEQDALLILDNVIKSNKLSMIVEDTGVQSAGESVPIGHEDCAHPYMTEKGTFCALPNRLDVAMHFLKTGGFDHKMESYEKMAARMLTFRHKLLNTSMSEDQLKLIYGEKFVSKVRRVCAQNHIKKFDLDSLVTGLFQFDVIVMLPGQELPMHLDIPYFWHADRTNMPHWLLVLMKRSGLFEERFIPQVQGVSWLSKHQFQKNEEQTAQNGGNFYFFPYRNEADKYILSRSRYNSAILVDGTDVIHGVERYMSGREPPPLEKNLAYYVAFNRQNNSWDLHDSADKVIGSYGEGDVRISLAWRMHCFKDDAEKQAYHNQAVKDQMSIEDVLEVFKRDLISGTKYVPPADEKKLDLFTYLIETYAKYPNKKEGFSGLVFNYCLIPLVMPKFLNDIVFDPLLKLIC